MPAVPDTHYATARDGVHIAYQVVGEGPVDLIFVPSFASSLEAWWDLAAIRRLFERLASFTRLILLDKRGTGQSDRTERVEMIEERMEDVTAVLDAVGSEHAVVWAASEGVPIACVFAATYPERTTGLILYGGMARWTPADDYPWAGTDAMYEEIIRLAESAWGTGFTQALLVPSHADDESLRPWFGRYERLSASPGSFATLTRNNTLIDVRAILPLIRVPTLVAHCESDSFVPVGGGRYLASRIPGARFVELPGSDHAFWGEGSARLLDEMHLFITGAMPRATADRALATVLFTDIVQSTRQAGQRGDREWKDLLSLHNDTVRAELVRFDGREVSTAGDSFLATFEGPARAIQCARTIRQELRTVGLEIRAGIHTGECERQASDIAGIAVHIGARVREKARPGEILVSRTVTDLVAGAGISFTDRGMHALKGVPGRWRLFAVS
jgi:class 3 adenylate cyclase